MISVLDFLEKRYINGEALFVNLEIPKSYGGRAHFIDSLNELSGGNQDVVVARDVLLNLYDYKEAFKKMFGALERGGGLLLLHEVSGAGETYLNTLFTSIRRDFVRAPTTMELLLASSDLFDIQEFHRFSSPRFFEVEEEALDGLRQQISSIPLELQDELQLSLVSNTLKVNVCTGFFSWTAAQPPYN